MAKFCQQCGAKNEEDSLRCEACGAVLDESGDAPTAAGAAPQPGQAAWQRASQGARARLAGIDKRILIGGAAAVALLVAGGVAWQTGLLRGLFPGGGASETASVDLDLLPVAFGDMCGYVDHEGRMQINSQFQNAGFFDDRGLAAVQTGGRWGLINRQGEYVVNPQFEAIRPAGVRGLYLASVSGRWGVIDDEGDYVINPQFGSLGPFDGQGRALAQSGERVGFVDREGTFIVPPQFEAVLAHTTPEGGVSYFPGGLAPALSGGRWGFIDAEGRWVINPQYAGAAPFDPDTGLAPVMITRTVETQDTAAAAAWEAAETSNEADAQRWGYAYTRPERPDFSITTEESVWGFVNREGQVVIAAQYPAAASFNASGLAPVMVGESWGYINAEGELVINPQFADARPMMRNGSGWIAVVATRAASGEGPLQYGAIDQRGTYLINPQFGGLGDFVDGRAAVSIDGSMSWNAAETLVGGGLVAQGDNVGVVDDSGQFIINPGYRLLLRTPGSRSYLFVSGDESAPMVGLLNDDGRQASSYNGMLCDLG